MSQIALPLAAHTDAAPLRVLLGAGNSSVVDVLGNPDTWPYATAILTGPPRSGKSLIGRWFAEHRLGSVIDDAERWDEVALFHRWNQAQADKSPLLLVVNRPQAAWVVRLPDLASRLASALQLEIGPPDDAMLEGLIALHAEARALALGEGAAAYLSARCQRAYHSVEALVAAIDRLSLERKVPPGMAVWRDALAEQNGAMQPSLL